MKIDNEKAKVRAALEKAKAGGEISAAERAAIDGVRVTLSGREGVLSGDLARTARGQPPMKLVENPTGSGGGPGVWEAKNEHMPPSAAAFQESVTGVRAGGHTYKVGGVEFDGVRVDAGGKVTLLEAKDGYANLLDSNGEPKFFANWDEVILNKVTKQAEKARALGIPLEIHCSQQDLAARLKRDLHEFPEVKIISPGDDQ